MLSGCLHAPDAAITSCNVSLSSGRAKLGRHVSTQGYQTMHLSEDSEAKRQDRLVRFVFLEKERGGSRKRQGERGGRKDKKREQKILFVQDKERRMDRLSKKEMKPREMETLLSKTIQKKVIN